MIWSDKARICASLFRQRPMTAAQIEDRHFRLFETDLSSSFVILARMEREGLVRRQPSATGKALRRPPSVWSLTARGIGQVTIFLRVHREIVGIA